MKVIIKTISTTFLLFLFLILSFSAQAYSTSSEDILGTWWTPKKNGRIEITKLDNKYSGKLVWGLPEDKDKLDSKNPDAAKRNQKILGTVLLNDFKFTDSEWKDGTIYDPETGNVYSCIITLDENKNLKVRGYIGFSFLGRTEIFTRFQ